MMSKTMLAYNTLNVQLPRHLIQCQHYLSVHMGCMQNGTYTHLTYNLFSYIYKIMGLQTQNPAQQGLIKI